MRPKVVQGAQGEPIDVGGVRSTGPIVMSGNGLVYFELRPDLDFETIRGNAGIPTLVTRGILRGFSLPIWADNSEELYFTMCVPDRYDGASDVIVHIVCWLDTANDGKKFGLELAWEHFSPGVDIVPAGSHIVNVQTSTGTAAQFQSFEVEFTIDYDIHAPTNIEADDQLGMRLRRIAADPVEDEIAGEVVIHHAGIIFRRDKLGVATP